MSTNLTSDPAELANLLRDLYLDLEDDGLEGSEDHGLARGLEDQLGGGQNIPAGAINSA